MNNEGTKITNFTDLDTWKKAHKLVVAIYEETKKFPKEEQFGLMSQMRRAAVSVTSNIAEGFSRQSYKDKSHFYAMAQASLTELQNQLLVSRDVGHMDLKKFDEFDTMSTTVHKLLTGLIRKSKEIHNS